MTHFLVENRKGGQQGLPPGHVPKGNTPDAKRGELAFRQRGCLACHSHKAIPDPDKKLSAAFGPHLSRIQGKIPHDPKNPTAAASEVSAGSTRG
ncbi:MAG: hypothetical protein CM1200mP2_51890 [Planctomycetaceae bacterium]|nr:MAG: hypothetical protein CM1200mP2_51890 [Planctomycetaceae bacterium]